MILRSSIEPLERRLLLAAISWTGGSGFWDDTSQWDLGRKPVFGDDVTIGGSGITVTVRNANERANSLNAAATLALDNGSSLFVDATSTLGGSLAINGGTLTLVGAATLAGTFTWTGGKLAPTAGLAANGPISINSTTNVTLSGDLTVNGVVTHDNTGNLALTNTSDLIINSDYNMTSDAGITTASGLGGAIPNIHLAGGLHKTGGVGTSVIDADGIMNLLFEGGDLDVQSGNLTISDIHGTSTVGVDIHVAGGSTLLFSSPAVTWSGTINGTGTGSVQLAETAISAGAGGLTFNFVENQLQWMSGSILSSAANPFTNAGGITLVGMDDKTVGVFLNNSGHWTHGGSGRLIPTTSGGATTFNNLSGGIYDFSADADNSIYSFNNAGLVRKAAGTAHSNFTGVGGFHNEAGGTVQVLSGKLVFEGGSTFTGGTNFNIASGAVLEFAGTNYHTFIGGTYTNTGLGTIHAIGPIQGDNTTPATFNFTGGAFQVDTFGQLWGTFTNAGTLNIEGNDRIYVRATITNTGTIYQFGTTTLQVNANSRIINQGTYDILGDGHILLRYDLSYGNVPFTNSGTLRKSGGTGTSRFGHETSAQGVMVLDNTGTIEAGSGTLAIEDTVTQVSGTTLGGGTWIAGASSAMTFPVNLTASNGSIVLDGAGAALGGVGLSSFTNGGQLTLGPAGHLNIAGDYIQTGAGTLTAQVGGPPASGQFGSMAVSDNATLGGTFVATAIGGFGPTSGQLYTVLSASAISGAFAAMNTPAELTPTVSANSVVLNGSGDPINLTVASVTAPATGRPGAATNIGYSVQNLVGDVGSTGTWVDSLYLSKDATFEAHDLLIGRQTHTGGVAAGGSYNETFTGPLPVALDGDYHIIVLADSRGLVSDSDRTNNFGISSGTTAVSLPALSIGSQTQGTVDVGQNVYYSLSLQAGQDVLLNTNFTVGRQGQVYVRHGELPDTTHFDSTSADYTAIVQPVLIHANQTGRYFVLIHGIDEAAGGKAFDIIPSIVTAGPTSVTANHGSNLGTTTVTISGSGFNHNSTASLILGGTVRAASRVQWVDGNTLFATFDLTGLAEGAYDLQTTTDGASATLADAFIVNAAPVGNLDYTLTHPAFILAGRTVDLTLEYINRGETDLPAPLFILSTDNGKFRLPDQTGFVEDHIEVLGINHSGPAGVLPPGARGTITIPFMPTVIGSHVKSNFTLIQAPRNLTMDWSHLKEDLRPVGLSDEAWGAIFGNFMAQVGTTSGQYADVIRENANYLSGLGQSINDPSRLLAYELMQAGNFGEISRRYAMSAFGRGQADPFDLRAQTDAGGNVTIRVGGRGRIFLKQLDGSYVDPAGDGGSLSRDGTGRYTVREKTGEITEFSADGKLDRISDANGNSLTAHYTTGRLSSLVSSSGDTTGFAYNPAGRISAITDAVGRVTTYAYDASNEHLLSITSAGGTISMSYISGQGAATEHAVSSIAYADGTHTYFEYDAQGRLTKVSRDGGAEARTFSYDTLGNVTITDALGRTTKIYRNAANQVAGIEDAMGNLAAMGMGSLSKPGGLLESITFDDRGNATQVRDAAGNALGLSYDSIFNRLLNMTDPRGYSTALGYDANGNLTSITDPAGQTQSFTYDAQGRPTSLTTAVGTQTVVYNSAGLISQRTYADGSSVQYSYDAHRNLLSATDGSGTVGFTYDSADRMTSVTYPDGMSLAYTYDSAGRRTRMTDQTGFSTTYGYNSLGRLASISDGSGAVVASYAYDATGRLERVDRGNGTATTYGYDAVGNILSVANLAPGGGTQSQFTYTYDALGRRTSVTGADGTTSYQYDASGQLTRAAFPNGRTIDYAYDPNGNRTGVIDSTAGTDGYSSNNLNQYSSIDSNALTYDGDGNLLLGDGATYTYNARGQLVSTSVGGDTFAYTYDATGNRLTVTRNGVTTRQLVDVQSGYGGTIVGDFQSIGDPLRHYIYGLGLTSQIAAGASSYYDFDALGNTVALTDGSGQVISAYTYLPFGELLSSSGSTVNPFTFSGQFAVSDRGDGLYFMSSRSFDPSLGRFTSRDPLGFAAGDANLYRYVHNDPINSVDPTGLAPLVAPPSSTAVRLSQAFEQALMGGARTVSEAPLVQTVNNFFANRATQLAAQNAVRAGVEEGVVSGAFDSVMAGSLLDTLAAQEAAAQVAIQNTGRAGVEIGLGGTLFPSASSAVTESAAGNVARTAVSGGGSRLIGMVGSGGIGILFAEFDIWNQQLDFEREFPDGDPVPVQEVINGPQYAKTIRKPLVSELLKRNDGSVSQDTLLFYLKLQSDQERLRAGRPIQPMEQVTSVDPNDIVGPGGYGQAGFIAPDLVMPYTINFQNKPDASAPAHVVTITQTLDSDLDLSTFAFGDMGFGSTHVTVPPGRQTFTTTVPLSGTLRVDITANLDIPTRTLSWTFTSIDPATGDDPIDPFSGFLPPDAAAGQGQGFVNYTIRAAANSPTATVIDAQASIVFDTNAPLATPAIVNTIDAGPPVSSIVALPAQIPTSYLIQAAGTDDAGGSGIGFYDFYVSTDGGPFERFASAVPTSSTLFQGVSGHTYGFYSIATDNVGNVEPSKSAAEATTMTTEGIALIPDPADPSRQALYVGGTTNADRIRLLRLQDGRIRLLMNGSNKGAFTVTSSVIVNGDEGNDTIIVAPNITLPTILDGGAGDDIIIGGRGINTLTGGNGNDLLYSPGSSGRLYGGAGNDRLRAAGRSNLLNGEDGHDSLLAYQNNILLGGTGNDRLIAGFNNLLIGGTGYDRLQPNRGGILIGGTTSYDSDPAALFSILDEWRRTDIVYSLKVDHLTHGGGQNGTTIFNQPTLWADEEPDLLTGHTALDWFIASPNDLIRGRQPRQEILTTI
ncbi:MAG: hypothetical protein IT446_02825 [Phycisphaerales bacterium]|nr:hypothetical protein [Phycisphaerales bacterium]